LKHSGAAIVFQFSKKLLPVFAFALGEKTQLHQCVVQLVSIFHARPGFIANAVDSALIEFAHVAGSLRIEPAPLLHGSCASLLERRVVEIGVRARVQNFLRQRRGFNHVASEEVLFIPFN